MVANKLEVIITAKDGVGSSQNGSPGVKNGGNSGLGNTDSLLFHSLVNGHSVIGLHFVKLINADNAAISKHHGAAFQLELPSRRVANHGGSESRSTGALPRSIHCDGSYSFDKFQELTLGSGGVADEQDVDISSELGLVGKHLPGPSEEQTGDCLFNILVAENGAGNARGHLRQYLFILCESLELLLILNRVDLSVLAETLPVSDEPQRVNVGDLKRLAERFGGFRADLAFFYDFVDSSEFASRPGD